jgi:hypothetical protein
LLSYRKRICKAGARRDEPGTGKEMNTKEDSRRQAPTPEEIDAIVTSQAADEGAWEKAIAVKRAKPGSFSIPPDLAERAAFLARVHHAGGLQEWLTKVIKERIELEEGAFAAVKRELKSTGEGRTPA